MGISSWLGTCFQYKPSVREARVQQLRAELNGHWISSEPGPDETARTQALALLNQTDEGKPDWKEICEVEVAIIKHLDLEALRVKHGNLRDEFNSVAGSDLAAAYFGRRLAVPRDADADNERKHLLAEAVDMVGQIYRLRIIRSTYGLMRKRITFAATFAAIVFVLVVIVFVLYETVWGGNRGGGLGLPFATSFIVIAGMLGGCFSALGRLYSVPWTAELAHGVDSLRNTYSTLLLNFSLSIVEGGVFAVLFYLACMGSFFAGSVFPKFKPVADAGGEAVKFFHVYFEMGLDSHGDYAKALIWSFAAGYLERMIPDFIGTLRPQVKLKPLT